LIFSGLRAGAADNLRTLQETLHFVYTLEKYVERSESYRRCQRFYNRLYLRTSAKRAATQQEIRRDLYLKSRVIFQPSIN
jgi:hypothetical protein